MSVPVGNHNRTVCPISETTVQFMPEEIQQNVCDLISVHERKDIQSLLCVNTLFKKRMSEHQQLAVITDEIRAAGKISFSRLIATLEKHLSTLVDLDPAPRIRLFHLLSSAIAAFPSIIDRDACCKLLWEKVGILPAPSRSAAISALVSVGGYTPHERIGAPIDDLPPSHQPEMLGLLSEQLVMCSKKKFPAAINALFAKLALLSDTGQQDALALIHKNTVASWQAMPTAAYDPTQLNAPPPLQFVLKERCEQIIDAARKFITTLPPDSQAIAGALWK